MKLKLTLLLLCVSILLSAQTIDSTALRQVDSLIAASRSLTDEQDFTGAYATNAQAEKIVLDKFGKESLAWGNTCFNHGRICYFEGHYAEAEPWYLASKALRERFLGKNDPEYAKSLNNLAIVYEEMSQYELAEPLYLEAMSIREKLLGKENASYANALSNLAGLYMELGAYEKSEWMNLEAKDIRERVLGKSHPDYAASLHNLANLYLEMGRYEKAEPLYLESKAIWQEAGSEAALDYALCLDNLGQVYQLMRKFEKSEQMYREALKLDEKMLGKEHASYTLCLGHLGSLYKDMGQYGKAEALYREALALSGKALGEASLDQATNLYRIAELYLKTGEYKKAIPLVVDANKIFEEKVGRSNSLTAIGLGLLAKLYSATGDFASAMPLYIEASQANKQLMLQASHHLSERELSAFSQKFDEQLSRDFSFAQVQPAMAPTCYDDILFYKGFLLNSVQQVGKLAAKDPVAAEKYNRFKSYHRLLAEEYAKPTQERSNVAELETAANDLEKELARTVKGLGPIIRQVGWEEVQSALGQGEAAIEFAHYQFLAPQPTATTNYVALVLLPGATAPYFVPLFEEKQLAAMLPKRNETGKLPAEALNRLYAANTSQLYALLWKPLEPYLAGVKTIYFSPTGLLHQLDIPAIGLPGGKGAILADKYAMLDIGSTRQLAAPKAETVAGLEVDRQHRFSGQEALLFGGIDYDLDSTAIAQHSTVPSDELDAELSLRNRGLQLDWMDSTDRGGTWSALPWTMVEVVAVEQMLKEQGLRPTLLQGSAATEEAFKQRKGQGPLILHLATHGYFFPAPKKAEAQQDREAGQVIKTSALPMIRSGLILAGGNYAWKEGKPAKAGMEDGILTAYEISQMDLANTELVVLSACETGLGDIQGNEGVYGLQRAFKIAGAKYIIMSLWQVPDYQTQQLMSSFYDFWLQGKLPIPDAFRSAQKTMREKFADPFYWAGFLLVQ